MSELLVEHEVNGLKRGYSKSLDYPDWPSESEIYDLARGRVNSYSNLELLEAMEEIMIEAKEKESNG